MPIGQNHKTKKKYNSSWASVISIGGFAQIARQLTELTEKKEWLEEKRGAFEKLKRMTNTPTLAIPKPNKEFRMKVDASGYAVGGVLSQQQEDKSWKPIAYLSRSMNKTERNYEIYDQELLAIMTGLKQWRQYLMGSSQFEVWTDHKNLEFFRKPKKLNRHQACWLSELQEYDF